MKIEEDPIQHAFWHFYHLDKGNASVHMADVRFSPITFGLAKRLRELHGEGVAHLVYGKHGPLVEVLDHVDKYELDHGR